MARLGRNRFLAIAVVFHLVYIYSIFDIYFVSPIVSGMRAYGVEGRRAPAQRLVLFVGDGLRADKAFQSFPDPSPATDDPEAQIPRPLAPFLRSRVLEHGTFGVSHTRVPTESRPGHVALIAGLYEDVSAVTTGWKLNPVNFDSVFNRSRHTWSWGSPDILPMFKEGAVQGRVYADTYGAEAEDFTQDATHLDTWVFDRVEALFEEAKTNATLNAELRQDKNVFFLHLLGLDTTGHAYRPYSREYLHNIKIVDQGVREVTKLIQDFYADGETAFVFTADHGMSDWGSHGDGHPDNTRTPLIAWGAGVAPPVKVAAGTAPGHEDGLSGDWGLSHVARHDVAQADVAALMAYLAGLDFPVNSVGELPLSYLNAEPAAKADALLANAREILEMYHVKEKELKAKAIRYRAFPGLGDEQHDVAHRVASIRLSIDSGRADEAIAQSEELIRVGLQGMRYLQTYDWLFLRALVTLGYLGWMAFAIATVVDLHVLHGTIDATRTGGSMVVFSAVGVALFSALWVQKSRWTYYAYAFFPVMFWEEVYARRAALVKGREVLFAHVRGKQDFLMLSFKVVAYLGLLEALVQSYFHREVFTFCYILAMTWPAFYGMDFVSEHSLLVATWWLSCSMMSGFTLLSAVKSDNLNLILLGGSLMFGVGVVYLVFEKEILAQSSSTKSPSSSKTVGGLSRTILGIQVGLIPLAMLVTRSSVKSLQAREGLPLGTQIVGWLVLLSSLSVPFLHSLEPNNHYIHRLVVIFLTFAPIFVILTISYEGLFYFAFCTTLVTWVRLEHHIFQFTSSQQLSAGKAVKAKGPAATGAVNDPTSNLSPSIPSLGTSADRAAAVQQQSYRSLTLSDARISLFSLYLLQSAFFSTGNIASISSFSLDAVYRLIPVFDPFSQGALLLLKLMIPFAVISANLGILNRRLGVAPSALFMVVMAVADVLTVRFFWVVRDEGSWLDIGTSISHFCISSALGVFVAALEGGSNLLVGNVEVDEEPANMVAAEVGENGNGAARKSR